MNSIAQAITGDANARALVLHIDDVGMCHGANVAFLELARSGGVTCGSIMVPCPWFREIASAAAQDPALDLGVHLTLTSEWPQYRWGPLSTCSRASGLIDAQGYFPRNCLDLRARLNVEASEIEFRAQIDRALEAGIDVTHLDTHMGTLYARPDYTRAYLQLAMDEGIPAMVIDMTPRNIAKFRAQGYPITAEATKLCGSSC